MSSDPDLDDEHVPMTDGFAVITPRITGSISFLSSSLIIYLICFRTKVKLSTIYHRIMIAMSCGDILGSIAMGLTTLPMPKLASEPDISTEWAGARLGNVQTCEAQGFMFVYGVFSVFLYNTSLCVYNACAIAFRLKEKRIMKYIEPLLHGVPIVGAIGFASLPLALNMYNSSPSSSWCTIAKDEVTGRGDDLNTGSFDEIILIAIFGLLLLLIFVSFVLIIWRVVSTEQALNGPNIIRTSSQRTLHARAKRSHSNTKIVLVQVMAYSFSYILTLGFSLVKYAFTDIMWVSRLQLVFLPLQGFFNAIIFISHKVYNYRLANNENMSVRQALQKLFTESNEDDQVFFSRISMLKFDEKRRIIELQLDDENGDVNDFVIDQPDMSYDDVDVFIDDQSERDGLSGFASTTASKSQGKVSSSGLSGFSSAGSKSQGEASSDDHDLSRGGLSGFSSLVSIITGRHSSSSQPSKEPEGNKMLTIDPLVPTPAQVRRSNESTARVTFAPSSTERASHEDERQESV